MYSKGDPCCGRYIKYIRRKQSTLHKQDLKGSQSKEKNYLYRLTSEEKEAFLLVWNLLAWSRASSMKPLCHQG
jgi:hypothetical protein